MFVYVCMYVYVLKGDFMKQSSLYIYLSVYLLISSSERESVLFGVAGRNVFLNHRHRLVAEVVEHIYIYIYSSCCPF